MHRKLHLLVAIVVITSLLVSATAFAQSGSGPRASVSVDGGEVQVGDRGNPQAQGPVSVVVHLNKPSLAQAGNGMSAAQRVAYAAEVAALQAQVAAQVSALGGTVIGQFKTLSSGLAVRIDAARVADLRGLANVTTVRQVNDYIVDLSSTVPFIGAADLQAAGLDGTGVTVAVLDDGVDYTHIKLGGSGLPADYAACAATKTTIGDCPFFPNAKIIGGYDFVGGTWPTTAEVPDPDPIALSFHGTHVADIIGGWGTDGSPTGPGRGVAPRVEEYLFKVCSEISTSCSGLALLLATDAAADLDGDPATHDPADVINASIGQFYGQPEDDWTAFANEAVANGSIYVISAGNDSDKPFIVSSASTATGAISVAQTSVPSDALFFIRINAPVAGLITNTAFQDWSVPLSTGITGNVLYDTTNPATRIGCNPDGSSPWTPGQFTGTNTVLLVDRGTCAGSLKAANASAAGASLVIIALIAPGAPFSFAYGGGTVTIPAFMVTQASGTLLKTAGTNVTMDPSDPALVLSLLDTMVGTSARGPRNHDGYIKPDIGAPGGSVSAEFGTGTGTTPFGGTSGAAPMVSGSAALLVQKYGDTPLPDTWHSEFGSAMPVFMYKSLLMNTANTTVYQDFNGGTLAPITRIGGGRVNVLDAANSGTLAWDETDHWIDSRFRTGSMSFGYQAVTGKYVTTRHGVVANLSDEDRWYDLSASFRYANDENLGVSLKVTPRRLFVPAQGYKAFFVKLTVDASQLRDWPVFTGDALNKGFNGNASAPLTRQEYDGYITIDGGENNTVHLAWQILPKRAASVRPTRSSLNFGEHDTSKTLTLRNTANFQAGDVDVFALVDQSPNIYYYEVFDDISFIDECTGGVFPGGSPGPGCNETPIDIKEVGVRDFGAGTAATNDDLIEFGVTIWDSPYRAGQFPVEFDVYIDSNRDGVDDWVVFNYDLALNGSDGRNAVFRCRANFTSCSAFFYTDSGVNTQNWILTVPAAAIGVAPGQAFNFQVFAADGFFTGAYTDCSPGDCASYHTYTYGQPKFAVNDPFPVVPSNGQVNLTVTKVAGGDAASPSQFGLLFMYRQAPIERESDSVLIGP